MIIRREHPGDAAAISALVEAAFLDAPHTSHTEHLIVDALRQAGALSVSLVAKEGSELIGHVAVSPVAISDSSTGWYGLGPIAVLPSHQQQGIGSRLMEAAIGELRSIGAAGCVLLGDPAFYTRFGFRPDPDLILEGVPPAYFLSLPLQSRRARGTVTYHPAFSL